MQAPGALEIGNVVVERALIRAEPHQRLGRLVLPRRSSNFFEAEIEGRCQRHLKSDPDSHFRQLGTDPPVTTCVVSASGDNGDRIFLDGVTCDRAIMPLVLASAALACICTTAVRARMC